MSTEPAGRGAARELIEFVLRHQNRWQDIVEAYRYEAPTGAATGEPQS